MRMLLLLLPLLFLGCAQPVTQFEIQNLAASNAVKIEDLRPQIEKQSEILSLSITSEAYGIYRKGDETLNPSMVRALQHRIYQKLGPGAQNQTIKLHHMVTYLNMKSELRKGALGGAIGAGIAAAPQQSLFSCEVVDPKHFEQSATKEHLRALYTESENPSKSSVFVIYIESEINGKRVFTKCMSSTKVPEGKKPHVVAMDAALDFHMAQHGEGPRQN